MCQQNEQCFIAMEGLTVFGLAECVCGGTLAVVVVVWYCCVFGKVTWSAVGVTACELCSERIACLEFGARLVKLYKIYLNSLETRFMKFMQIKRKF